VTVTPQLPPLRAPGVLSRAELVRRARALDGTLPAALPVGGTVSLAPDRVRAGRNWLRMLDVTNLDAGPAGGAEAAMGCRGEVYLNFDATAGARYILDLSVAVEAPCSRAPSAGNRPSPIQVRVLDPVYDAAHPGHIIMYNAVDHTADVSDGHAMVVIRAPRTARQMVSISAGWTWRFYRLDLTRVP
jgi:hypothetical protein